MREGMMKCGCSDPECDLIICVTCHTSECKWPGACEGKCIECGGPARSVQLGDSPVPLQTCHCSDECVAISTKRWTEDGSFVLVSDLTPEQLNKAFNRNGLALEGVGPRQPS